MKIILRRKRIEYNSFLQEVLIYSDEESNNYVFDGVYGDKEKVMDFYHLMIGYITLHNLCLKKLKEKLF
jgi:hypothetical protein